MVTSLYIFFNKKKVFLRIAYYTKNVVLAHVASDRFVCHFPPVLSSLLFSAYDGKKTLWINVEWHDCAIVEFGRHANFGPDVHHAYSYLYCILLGINKVQCPVTYKHADDKQQQTNSSSR